MKITRRSALLGAGTFLLAGCGNSRNPNLSAAADLARSFFADRAFTDADVERVPFASIGVQLGTAPEAMVVLATVDGNDLTWIAADRSLIVTRHGRIIRFTSGDIDVVTAPGSTDPVADGAVAAGDCMRLLDFPKAQLFSVPAQSTLAATGQARVTLLHGEITTRSFTETGISHPLAWEFENHFYLDAETKRVWQSNQNVTPQLPPIKIRVLRPYSGDIA
ncbi:YjbF family lipoprotein [Aliidongia dinghuensis]|nr:YjbF family lipoprotein [Aliidongia dinghuensis]